MFFKWKKFRLLKGSRFSVARHVRSIWKILFALLALVDVWTCWPLLRQGWNNETVTSNETAADIVFCSNPSSGECYLHMGYMSKHLHWLVGWLFLVACLVEAAIRAQEARILAMEMHALDVFEEHLRNASSRISITVQQSDMFARSTVRTYVPVVMVVSFWVTLLPRASLTRCGNDEALATMWIMTSTGFISRHAEHFQDIFANFVWHSVMPYKAFQPKRFIGRLRVLMRGIRYARFAGPFVRMGLKLLDQFNAMAKTWRQTITVQTERAKRLARRSLILDDIRRIESLAKIQTSLAALPSSIFRIHGPSLTDSVAQNLRKHQQQGRVLRQRLDQLRAGISRNIESVVIYDQLVKLTQDVRVKMNRASLLTSHRLISPRSRFSVVWRITVTNCLMIEVVRLCASWYLTGTFRGSLTAIISHVLIECRNPHVTKRFRFVSDRVDRLRQRWSFLLPFLSPPEALEICVPKSASATIFLQVGSLLESFVDMVAFVDILVWFLTGDIDSNGVVIPKHFFTRCILPGTLVQVMDHPTLPDALPGLISRFFNASVAVGLSRVMRWSLAIGPALKILIITPAQDYFFRHFDVTEGLMRYAESFGMISGSQLIERSSFGFRSISEQGSPLGRRSSIDRLSGRRGRSGLLFDTPLSPLRSSTGTPHTVEEDGDDFFISHSERSILRHLHQE